MPNIRASLNKQILLALTLSVAAVMVAIIYLSDAYQRDQMLQELSHSNEDLILTMLAGIRYPMSIGDNASVHRQLDELRTRMPGIELYICDVNRKVIFATEREVIGKEADGRLESRDAVEALSASLETGIDSPREYEELTAGSRYLAHVHVIPNSPECFRCHGDEAKVIGAAVLRRQTDRQYAAIANLRHATVVISLFGIGAIVGLVHLLLRSLVVAPIGALSAEIRELPERISRGEAIGRIPVERSDEIGIMQKSFHHMAWELDNMTHAMERANRELEFANRELESFAYSVSHDLRAPLRNIDGFSKILLDEFSQKLDDRAKHYLMRVRNGALRMSLLIDDILVFSRIGRAEMQFRVVNGMDLVRGVIDYFSAEIEQRKVKMTVGEMPSINCDSTLAQSLFSNLVSNAIKYTRQVSEPMIEIGYDRSRQAVFVRDNGVGFEMKYHDKIFQVFQRLHLPEEYEGTGIGLAIVKRIAERHHWQVWAESQPGKGATFFVKIPELEGQHA